MPTCCYSPSRPSPARLILFSLQMLLLFLLLHELYWKKINQIDSYLPFVQFHPFLNDLVHAPQHYLQPWLCLVIGLALLLALLHHLFKLKRRLYISSKAIRWCIGNYCYAQIDFNQTWHKLEQICIPAYVPHHIHLLRFHAAQHSQDLVLDQFDEAQQQAILQQLDLVLAQFKLKKTQP